MSPFDPDRFMKHAPCTPCCATPACTFTCDGTAFDSLVCVNDQVVDYGFTFTAAGHASQDTNFLHLDGTTSDYGYQPTIVGSVEVLTAGTTLSFDVSGGGDQYFDELKIEIFEGALTGSSIGSHTETYSYPNSSGSFLYAVYVSTPGQYFIKVTGYQVELGTVNVAVDVTSDLDITICTII